MLFLIEKLNKIISNSYRFFAIIHCVNDAFEFDECEFDCNLKFFLSFFEVLVQQSKYSY